MLGIKQNYRMYFSFALSILLGAIVLLGAGSVFAGPKVFTARFNEDAIIERLYEAKEVSLTIIRSHDGDKFLEKAIVSGIASIDSVSGRVFVELEEVVQAGMPMEVVGYVVGADKEQGIAACSQWQTRMFEDAKLCYAAEVLEDREVELVVSIDAYSGSPVVQAVASE